MTHAVIEKMINLKGKTALIKSGKVVLRGRIVAQGDNQNGVPTQIFVKIPGQKATVEANWFDEEHVAVLASKSQSPAGLKRILKKNPKADIATCLIRATKPWQFTIVCTKSLGRLHSKIVSKEVAEITGWQDGTLREGKTELTESDTTYWAGRQAISIAKEPERY